VCAPETVYMFWRGDELSSLTGFRTPLLPVHSLVTMEAPIHKRIVRTLLPGVLKLFLFLCVETASGIFHNL
jgi:hypothetical protein